MDQNFGPMGWEELLARVPSMRSSPALADVLGLRKKAEEREQPPMMSQGYGSIPSAPPPTPMQPMQPMQQQQAPVQLTGSRQEEAVGDPMELHPSLSEKPVSGMSPYSDLNRSGFGALGGLLFGKEALRDSAAYDDKGNFRGMFPMAKGLLSKMFDSEDQTNAEDPTQGGFGLY